MFSLGVDIITEYVCEPLCLQSICEYVYMQMLGRVRSPRLSWRDMQHIVVRTARKANLVANDWVRNAVGRLGRFII